MAKPRVFVSSTYYDLRHIRSGLESFIDSLGYDAVLFESGDVPFSHEVPLDESCYKEIGNCHILVLIIGGRYGSAASDSQDPLSEEDLNRHYQHYNSITQKEYETARDADIPIFIFVEKGVAAEYVTYKENRDNDSIAYAHVDNVSVFRLVDSIYGQRRNNPTREFEKLEDITTWLKDQWAGLFADFLVRKSNAKPLKTLALQLASLENVTETLKEYSESIIRGIAPEKSDEIISNIDGRLKHKSTLSRLSRNSFVSHLNETHNAPLESMLTAFVEAKDLSDLKTRLKATMPKNEQCFALDEMDTEEFFFKEELEEILTELGLPLFKEDPTKPSSG